MISCANYEARFKTPLISSILFPQKNGRCLYNPRGKYIVKLYFNGIPRKVVVDYRIPISANGSPLCTYSKNEGELWPILVEKAFLKVHGGYSYDGGNGGQDTYSLTGWIPELIYSETLTDKEWVKIMNAFKYVFYLSEH